MLKENRKNDPADGKLEELKQWLTDKHGDTAAVKLIEYLGSAGIEHEKFRSELRSQYEFEAADLDMLIDS